MYKFWFDKGYNVIPIKADGKHPPLVKFTPFRDTRITKEQLEEWWSRWPRANVGVLCGGINRLAVLDCDGEAAANIIKCLGLPETASVKTPHGRHLYFRVPEGYTVKTIPQGGLRVNGCELRGEGSYVVAPPSSVNGVLYYWETSLSAGVASLRDVPAEVVFFDGPFEGVGAASTFNERLKGAPEGARNMNLASIVGSLLRSGTSYEETKRLAIKFNLENRPPLDEKEVLNIVNSIWKTHFGVLPSIHCKSTPPIGGVPPCYGTKPEASPDSIRGDGTPEVVEDSLHCNATRGLNPSPPLENSNESPSGAVATNPMVPQDEPYWRVKPISDLPPIEPIDWLFEGYIAKGRITELVGIWKSGKTTLLTTVLKAMENGGEVAGRRVKKAKAIVISEESEHEWIDRRERLKLTNSTSLVCQPFKTKPTSIMWNRFIDNIATQIEGYELIVIDSLASLWPVVDENNSSAVVEALIPLRHWTEMGKALLLIHHPKKSDATEGRASRGSGGLPAYVDILLEFRRHGRADTTKRVITAYSRRPETPTELIIDYVNNNYVLLGEGGLPDEEERLKILLGLLPAEPPGLSRDEILKRWGGTNLKPTANQLWRDIKTLIIKKRITPTGKGTKTEPYSYVKKGDNSSVKEHNKDGAVS